MRIIIIITDDIKEDVKEEDEENTNLLITDLYSHVVAMMYMYWKEKYIIDYLKSSVLSYLYHSLHIADDVGMIIARHIHSVYIYSKMILQIALILVSKLGCLLI